MSNTNTEGARSRAMLLVSVAAFVFLLVGAPRVVLAQSTLAQCTSEAYVKALKDITDASSQKDFRYSYIASVARMQYQDATKDMKLRALLPLKNLPVPVELGLNFSENEFNQWSEAVKASEQIQQSAQAQLRQSNLSPDAARVLQMCIAATYKDPDPPPSDTLSLTFVRQSPNFQKCSQSLTVRLQYYGEANLKDVTLTGLGSRVLPKKKPEGTMSWTMKLGDFVRGYRNVDLEAASLEQFDVRVTVNAKTERGEAKAATATFERRDCFDGSGFFRVANPVQ